MNNNLNLLKAFKGRWFISLITVMCLQAPLLYSQKKPAPQPFIIQGQLINSPEKSLLISFQDQYGQTLIDSIQLNNEGKFYLKTYKVTGPQLASIQRNRTQMNAIFVAPGYNLTVTGDAKDFATLLKTTQIIGKGAAINNYRAVLNAAISKNGPQKLWFRLNQNELLAYIKAGNQLHDSVIRVVFDAKKTNMAPDKYLAYFKNMIQLDNAFVNLDYLAGYVNAHKLSYAESVAFVRDNFDHHILDDIGNEKYLVSKEYKDWIVANDYLDYLVKLDYMKDSTLKNHKFYKIEKANKMYKGKVRDYVFYNYMNSGITYSTKSIDQLNQFKEQFKPYIDKFSITYYRNVINKQLAQKEAELLKTGVGQPVPAFTLESSTGKTYSLADFKGKVVYLDLWASWCGPCREQTPSLSALYAKYKNDDRITFISVAVHDGADEWRKALKEDKPAWLQLLDKDGIVGKYYVANVIPQFVIIDKQGKIVDFNAPEPSSGKQLENVLLKQMEKQ